MAPIVELWGDLFAMQTSLAHCVSRDLRMTAGIADVFRVLYGRQDELLAQRKLIGDVAFIASPKSGFIFYLITKDKYYNRHVDISCVKRCLLRLRQLCIYHRVPEVSLPRISCGLDGLVWSDVLRLISHVFSDSRVRVNVLTPPPCVHAMAILGDSQALRLVRQLGTVFPEGSEKKLLAKSGQRLSGLLRDLETVPDNGLFETLIFIGSNDLLDLCRAGSTKAKKNNIRGLFAKLRCVVSAKVKPCCRAVVLTVPPLPLLLQPKGDEFNADKTSYLRKFINDGLKKLSNSRFHVLDLDDVLMQDGVVREDMFERTMGRNRREDRIHLNLRGMRALKAALQALPVLET